MVLTDGDIVLTDIAQPVHPAGRYFKNTLVEILQTEFGFKKVYSTCVPKHCLLQFRSTSSVAAVNRLDRLTSGLMILPTNPVLANEVTQEFFSGRVGKEYVARCKGEFPE